VSLDFRTAKCTDYAAGPWTVERDSSFRWTLRAPGRHPNNNTHAEVNHRFIGVIGIGSSEFSKKEAAANAALIVKAPEMLTALIAIRERVTDDVIVRLIDAAMPKMISS
jgi:hypothetical protein